MIATDTFTLLPRIAMLWFCLRGISVCLRTLYEATLAELALIS
jgi:hypothetical protein